MNVRRPIGIALLLSFCAPLVALPALAQDAAMPAGVKGEMMMWIKDAESKLAELSEAMPEAKYGWRPVKGVRTVGEIYMHVATANFGIPSFLGVKPPEGFDPMKHEKSLTKKADITRALKASFAHMEQALMNASDEDMDKPAEFFGMKTTARGAYLLLLSHAHEHLGQSIAYARSNNVTPPWTAREQAAAQQEKEKK